MAGSHIAVTPGSGDFIATGATYTEAATVVKDQKVIEGEPYLACYHINASGVPTATAASHLLQIMAGASLNVYIRRIFITQMVVATSAALARFQVFRLSSAGTGGSALTPAPLNTADPASGATAMVLPSVKGTETTGHWLQAAQFIQTIPASGSGTASVLMDLRYDSPRSKSLIIPAGTANGIVVKMVDAVANAQVIVMAELIEAPF